MKYNVKFHEEVGKIAKIFGVIKDLEPMEIKSKFPELWEALLDAETQIDEVV